jgi:hypothetical protein
MKGKAGRRRGAGHWPWQLGLAAMTLGWAGAVACASRAPCGRRSRLTLRITPALDFEAPSGMTFTLKGPC